MNCGAQLEAAAGAAQPAASSEPPAPAAEASGPPEAQTLDERRTVTVLFADLSGYTAVAEKLDPESVKGVLERILARLGEDVARYGGHVDKFIGDNVMAVFGAPIAHHSEYGRSETGSTESHARGPARRVTEP